MFLEIPWPSFFIYSYLSVSMYIRDFYYVHIWLVLASLWMCSIHWFDANRLIPTLIDPLYILSLILQEVLLKIRGPTFLLDSLHLDFLFIPYYHYFIVEYRFCHPLSHIFIVVFVNKSAVFYSPGIHPTLNVPAAWDSLTLW